MYSTVKSSPRVSVDEPVEMITPTLSLVSSQVPEIARWQVGKEYYLLLKVKEASAHVNQDNDIRALFKVLEAAPYEHNG